MRSQMLEELITLEDSTTLFLEHLKGELLKVKLISQVESLGTLKRTVVLFFDSNKAPVLYCESSLKIGNIMSSEYKQLIEGKQPIGKVFNYKSPTVAMKKGIEIKKLHNRLVADTMNVRSQTFYKKTYSYVINGRDIGQISEFFNMETLNRL